MLIDTHTHLYLPQFDNDRKEVIARAVEKGISKFYLPNIDLESIYSVKKMENDFPDYCKSMMGLHPCSVKDDYKEVLGKIGDELFGDERYVAVGEIGIDLYWDRESLKIQEEAFKEQIRWAKTLNIPIIIHSRDALEFTIKCVKEEQDGKLKGVFHCFTGSVDEANQIKDLNFMIGIGGVLSFKNAGLDITMKNLSLDNVVLETDSPYLAPVPYRGKRNESSYIIEVAKKLGEVKKVAFEEIEEITTKNALQLFHED